MTAERKMWPGHASQAERRRARLDIVLEDIGITSATLERYLLCSFTSGPGVRTGQH
jgi:hypothetical protein